MKKQSDTKKILNFIAEAGLLKRIQRSGWWVLGIKNAESVADHSFRCAVIAYIIARCEKVSPYRAVLMALFNDIHEARINDSHKMAQRYFDAKQIENKAFKEQVEVLPKNCRSDLFSLRKEYVEQTTTAGIIARDADILECLVQAKEYCEHGFKEAARFMKKAPDFLRTKTARKLWQLARQSNLNDWWEDLSSFAR